MVKNPPANAEDVRDLGSSPGSGRSPGERNGYPTPVFLPGESHRQRNLEGYSPWGCKESDTTERVHYEVHLVKAMAFPVVMYGCESWTVKKAESQRTDAFEL